MTLANAASDVAYGASSIGSKFFSIAPIPSLRDRGDRDEAFAVSPESLSQKGAALSSLPFLNIIDEF